MIPGNYFKLLCNPGSPECIDIDQENLFTGTIFRSPDLGIKDIGIPEIFKNLFKGMEKIGIDHDQFKEPDHYENKDRGKKVVALSDPRGSYKPK